MSFSLDDIVKAAEKKYGSYDIDRPDDEVLHLRNVLRLSKEERKQLSALQTKLSTAEVNEDAKDEEAEEVDETKVLEDVILLLAHNKTMGKALIKDIGSRLDVLLHIFTSWNEGTEMGEATASQD